MYGMNSIGAHLFHTNMEFSYAVAVMDKIGGWEERKKMNIKLAHVLERVCGSLPK